MNPSVPPCQKPDRVRLTAYVLVALAGLLAGYILGVVGGQASGSSRVGWPPPIRNPRSFSP
jgi:hypothetical protein